MKCCGNARWWSLMVVCLLLAAAGMLAASDRLHPKVLAAFRETIAEPSKSTVQVYCDGYRGALGAIVDPDGYVAPRPAS